MRQLTSLDAQFLALENARQSGHVGGLAILDPTHRARAASSSSQDVQQMLAERLPLLPPLRWRLAEVPFGLDYPYWVDDADFDLDFHVRELALPPPGTDEKLAEQVARIFSRPLDRARPLWELYLIHGLEDGKVAMLTKIHHAVIDGLSGAEIMGVLFDLEPDGRARAAGRARARQRPRAERGRDARPRRARPAALPAAHAALAAERAAEPRRDPVRDPARRRDRRQGIRPAAPASASATAASSSGPTTSRRGRRSTGASRRTGGSSSASLELDEVKEVKNAHGCTVNDVVVSICAGAVRRWLIEHAELPADPLVAQIPVSVRSEEQQGTYGNRIMLMSAPLFTNVVDPVERLHMTHEALASMKERHRALPAELLQDANHFIPPAVFARAARATFTLASSRPRPPDLEPRDLERARARSSRSTAPAPGWWPTTRSR